MIWMPERRIVRAPAWVLGNGILEGGGASAAAFTDTKSLSLNGIDQYVDVGTALNSYVARDKPFTLSIWLKSDDYSHYIPTIAAVDISSGNPGTQLLILPSPGQPEFQLNSDNSTSYIHVYSNTTLSTGVWYHIAATYDGSGAAAGVAIYINGLPTSVTVQHDLTGTPNCTPSESMKIGYDHGDNLYGKGLFDEAAFYSVALSSSDIAAIYNSGHAVDLSTLSSYSNCKGWWRFENDFTDSASTNNGTGINSPTFSASVP